jgi:hypothetical protein
MRLSIVQNDPGFSAEGFSGAKVTLDGVEVSGPVTANEEDGWVRSRLDRSDETYVRRGKVEIVQAAKVAASPSAETVTRKRESHR